MWRRGQEEVKDREKGKETKRERKHARERQRARDPLLLLEPRAGNP